MKKNYRRFSRDSFLTKVMSCNKELNLIDLIENIRNLQVSEFNESNLGSL